MGPHAVPTLEHEVTRLRDENRRRATALVEAHRLNAELRGQVEAAQQQIAPLRAQVQALRAQVDEAQRGTKRPAAPFRRRDRKKVPPDQKKKSGRKPGHPGANRAVPEHVDHHAVVRLPGCPCRGGAVEECRPVEQFIEEVPEVKPVVTRVVTYVGLYAQCGEVRSEHPLQMSGAEGDAKVQFGPRALALAAWLRHRLGCTERTMHKALRGPTGLKMSPGGLVQAFRRHADNLKTHYDQLIADVRKSPAVFADETSWYVGMPKWWPGIFTTPTTTVFRIEPHRDAEVVLRTLGADFAGMLVSDCLAVYESRGDRRQTCEPHHLRAIASAEAIAGTTTPEYLRRWTLFFLMVRTLWKHRAKLGSEAYARQVTALKQTRDALAGGPCALSGDQSIRDRLTKRLESLTGCLDEPAAEPTNNRSERGFRFAVIARKLSCGNRTNSGKSTYEVLTSLACTSEQRGIDFVRWMASNLPRPAPVTPLTSPNTLA